jgi:hypothetical protein
MGCSSFAPPVLRAHPPPGQLNVRSRRDRICPQRASHHIAVREVDDLGDEYLQALADLPGLELLAPAGHGDVQRVGTPVILAELRGVGHEQLLGHQAHGRPDPERAAVETPVGHGPEPVRRGPLRVVGGDGGPLRVGEAQPLPGDDRAAERAADAECVGLAALECRQLLSRLQCESGHLLIPC